LDVARALERRAAAAKDPEALAVALRALGLASRSLGDLGQAEAFLRRSVTVAQRAGLGRRAGEARITLSSVLLLRGQATPALREADRALPLVDGYEAARLRAQIGWILQRLGRADEALRSYGAAVQALRRMGRMVDAARVCTNRGILQAYRGNFRAAETDLRDAERMYAQLGLALPAAQVRHNLGFVATRRGDIPAALAYYDAAAQEFSRLGVARPAALLDRCDALLAVGLAREARPLAELAVSQLEAAGFRADLAEARLVLAQACLLMGDNDEAVRMATTAHRVLVRQGRSGWAALARYLALRGKWQQGRLGPRGERRAAEVAAELESVGWGVAAVDALLIAGRAGSGAKRSSVSQDALASASARRRTGPAEIRARAWHAEALLRLDRGQSASAMAALRAGLRVLDRHHATLGATELRVHAAAHGSELATLGLRLALEGRRASTVLAWAERCRATADRHPRPRPPKDTQLARDLAALRKLSADHEEAAFGGFGASSALSRRVALEAAIRRRSRHVPGLDRTASSEPPSVAELAESLDDAALVEFVDVDGTLHVVTVAGGRVRMRALGDPRLVAEQAGLLRFCLERLARAGAPRASVVSAGASMQRATARLDRMLMDPVAGIVDDRPLVIIPTGPLHDLPWAALPSCARRPVTVAASARQWLAARRRVPPARDEAPGQTQLVAGPGLQHGRAEVAELSKLHPSAVALTGRKASVDRVLAALADARLAHVVAHGRLRSDNPMFSALTLWDGPLTVYDLERSGRMPATVILASCHVGASVVARGDELIGFASSLVALGTGAVVASLAPVPDATSRKLMVELHRRLRTGTAPALALAEARLTVQQGACPADPDDASLVALVAFGCLGAG
jgi:tetratricopeptide (TPR) repeat protein